MTLYRPAITGTRHTIVSGHYLATSAGFQILESGGNAVDAGCAAGIVLGVFVTLLAVPFLQKYVTKSRYHTVVGDHDDLRKDLKTKHK